MRKIYSFFSRRVLLTSLALLLFFSFTPLLGQVIFADSVDTISGFSLGSDPVKANYNDTDHQLEISGKGQIDRDKWETMLDQIGGTAGAFPDYKSRWSGQQVDRWGNPYNIVFKGDYDSSIILPKYCQNLFRNFSNNIIFEKRVDARDTADMSYMFDGAKNFNSPIDFNCKSAENMECMFRDCHTLNSPVKLDNTAKVTNMSFMFQEDMNFNQPIEFDCSSVLNMEHMFYICESLNSPVKLNNTGNVTNMAGLFGRCYKFNQGIQYLDTSSVEDMTYMFYSAKAFTGTVNGFDTSNVTSMRGMFYGAESFNNGDDPLDNMNTSKVVDMSEMFKDAKAFNNAGQTLDFDTSKVTNTEQMFRGAEKFNSPFGNNFTTSTVENMKGMFHGAKAFNQPVRFDTSKVKDFGKMFRGAVSFEQDVEFDTSSATNPSAVADIINNTKVKSITLLSTNASSIEGGHTFWNCPNLEYVRVNNLKNDLPLSEMLNNFSTDYYTVVEILSDGTKKFVARNAKDTEYTFPEANKEYEIKVAKAYNVIYDLDGGAGGPANSSKYFGDDIALDAATRAGYAFSGWQYAGQIYQPTDSLTMPDVADDITLVAQWQIQAPTDYTVSYDKNDGSAPVVACDNCHMGDNITVAADAARAGYDFLGWQYNNVLYRQSTTQNSFIMPAGNVTLVAQWQAQAPTEYTVSYDKNDGSAPVVDRDDCQAGDSIAVAADAVRAGYDFLGWQYNNVLYRQSTTQNSFTMPAGDVTLVAQWQAKRDDDDDGGDGEWISVGGGDDETNNDTAVDNSPNSGDGSNGGAADGNGADSTPTFKFPFTDVAQSDWFYSSVLDVYRRGVMLGTSSTLFSPDMATTRGMMITIIFRLSAETPIDGSAQLYYDDVADGKYYSEAVNWGTAKGIVRGYGDRTFKPDQLVTREEFVEMVGNYAKFKGYDMVGADALTRFKDGASVQDYAKDNMSWAIDKGIIKGVSSDLISPMSDATRAQAAAIFSRFIQLFSN